jgi:uncharacterized membrane protein YhaH (DUF805 family)
MAHALLRLTTPAAWHFMGVAQQDSLWPPTAAGGAMDLINVLFSFAGRIGRGQFWLAAVTWIGFAFAVYGLIWLFLYVFNISPSLILSYVVATIVFVPILVSAVAVGVKRLHDRNKNGWWLLVFYLGLLAVLTLASLSGEGIVHTVLSGIGFVLLLWAFVELGCLRGTIAGNPYGPDPVAPKPAVH